MEFQFYDTYAQQNRQSRQSKKTINMDELIENFDKNSSINWDDFGIENLDQSQQPSVNQSEVSDLFNQQKEQPTQNIQQVNNSRNMTEISIQNNNGNENFQFNKSIQYQPPKNNERYERLQKLLNKAKGNNLQAFYKNLDRMSQQKYQDNIQFKDRKQFENYITQYKQKKRIKEMKYQQQKNKQQQQNYKFKKRKSQQQQKSNINFYKKSSNMLLSQYQSQEQQFNNKNQLQIKQDLIIDGQAFFDLHSKNNQPKKIQQRQYLPSIRQQKQNIFEKTLEEQNLFKIMNNYNEMKSNYNALMEDLKHTCKGQQHIFHELKKTQQDNRIKQQKQIQKKQKKKQQKSSIKKNQYLNQIKQQIQSIKTKGDDIILTKMHEKIQNLQSLLQNAVKDIVEVKQTKILPTIVNYSNYQNFKDPNLSENCSQNSNNFQSIDKQSGYNYCDSVVKNKMKSQIKSEIPINDDFASPFQLDLSQHSQMPNKIEEDIFKIPQNAKEYFPKTLRNQNRNLRKCLTQKSSLIYESFEFHISGKFSISEDQIHPIQAEIRVGNKCAINLSDILVIVYGFQGCDIPTKPPSRIYQEQLYYGSCFNFQVSLNKQCLLDFGFTIHISYRTDLTNKKKMTFKVVLPICNLIKPQFIYENQFIRLWNTMNNQMYIKPNTLDFNHIRTHEDIKIVLPFLQIDQPNSYDTFSYGLIFKYPKIQALFMLKLCCYINGKASIHLKSDKKTVNISFKQKLLDIINHLFMINSGN